MADPSGVYGSHRARLSATTGLPLHSPAGVHRRDGVPGIAAKDAPGLCFARPKPIPEPDSPEGRA